MAFTCPAPPTDERLTIDGSSVPNFSALNYTNVLSQQTLNTINGVSQRIGAAYSPLKPSYVQSAAEVVINTNGLYQPGSDTSTNPNDNYVAFREKTQSFLTNARAEYCYIFRRYTFYITQFIQRIPAATSGTTDNTEQNNFNLSLLYATQYNTRLSDFAQIINEINRKIFSNNASIANQTNGLNADISRNYNALKEQAEILKSEAPAAELKRRMVDYTKEKAKSTNNLLSLYFFLDLVALGMLFYVYKAGTP